MGICMNERIQELWDKATFDESRIVDGVYHPYIALQFMGEPGRYSITDEQKAKFAELIVRECVTAIINDRRLNDIRSAANGCVRTINEHFGVEE